MRSTALSGLPAMLACLLAIAGCASTPTPAPAPDPRPPLTLVGYVTAGEPVRASAAAELDVANFAFAAPDAAHRVGLGTAQNAAALSELVRLRQRAPGLRVVLSIGGWGAGHFSEAAATPQTRAVFVDSAMALLRQYDLDGLDIDWEYPTLADAGISASADDKAHFTALLSDLRAALDAQGARDGRRYLLTIAAAEGRLASGLDLPAIAPLLDWINLMTYDFYGSLTPTTGHAAALGRSRLAPAEARTTETAVDSFLRAGVPAAKLHVGMAFYGRRFGEVAPRQAGLLQPYRSDGGFISYRQIVEGDLTGSGGFESHWDPQARAAWLWNPRSAQMISYEDPRALREKVAYARAQGLGGVMFWELHQDHGQDLLDVVRQAIDAPAPAAATSALTPAR
ncbi:glycoside hydrolase family 18 protein [Pseudoxanthomonas winnipegensis]|uniref:chitinase n=1 Tax=Pseudoxanthomonas winnipegensis TaxID=2480810 RepID=A0A4V2HCK3_9GAMM|nr:glycoside hydrolase family 18 protein [Pseudoxanthomonas winnipegensis]TAA21305.1 glycoside hydrolase family 18 protein [Pseudoxanthomonas winnipegensis]